MKNAIFIVNGEEKTVNIDESGKKTLAAFLREECRLFGLKVVCGVGVCGSCCVNVKTPTRQEWFAVNSCLVNIRQCNGWQIKTIEDLAQNSSTIIEKFSSGRASQCGFCTPGMIMCVNAANCNGGSITDLEECVAGNLCRCTGYVGIVEACRELHQNGAGEVENEDKCAQVEDEGLDEFVNRVNELRSNGPVSLYAGNTASFLKMEDSNPVSIMHISELRKIRFEESNFHIGSTATFHDLIKFIQNHLDSESAHKELLTCLKSLLQQISNPSIRNIATIGGNIMLHKAQPAWVTDLIVFLSAVGGSMKYIDLNTSQPTTVITKHFISSSTDSKQMLLTEIIIPLSDNNFAFCERVSARARNAPSLVTFCAAGKLTDGCIEQIRISCSIRVNRTGVPLGLAALEREFCGASLDDILEKKEEYFNILATLFACKNIETSIELPCYHKFCVQGVIHKLLLSLTNSNVQRNIERAQQTSMQEIATTNGKSLAKLEAKIQCEGKAKYTGDEEFQDMRYLVPVLSDCSSGTIVHIGYEECKDIRVFTATDFKVNQFLLFGGMVQMVAENKVEYYGQPVALVVGRSREEARDFARTVKVTYAPGAEPVHTIKQAVQADTKFSPVLDTFPNSQHVIGDCEKFFQQSSNVVQSSLNCGTQQHFPLEVQTSVAVPLPDGMQVYSAAQGSALVQDCVAKACELPCSKVEVCVERVGGAFGSKENWAAHAAALTAVCAKSMDKPVKLSLSLEENLLIYGGRWEEDVEYECASDENGVIQAIKMILNCNIGMDFNQCLTCLITRDVLHLFPLCKNWHLTVVNYRTNLPARTFCRSPMSFPAHIIASTIIDHIAQKTQLPVHQVLKANLATEGTTNIERHEIKNLHVEELYMKALKESEYEKRLEEVEDFNEQSPYIKRGLAITQCLFMIPLGVTPHYKPRELLQIEQMKNSTTPYKIFTYHTTVALFARDGSAAVDHGGIEMGQGINTKVAKVVSDKLGIEIEKVKIQKHNTFNSANDDPCVASRGSETCCRAAQEACDILLQRIEGVRNELSEKEGGETPTWQQLLEACVNKGVDLVARSLHQQPVVDDEHYYYVPSFSVSEVELDSLTGDRCIRRSDLFVDSGRCDTPLIDVGQIEGGFVFGIGHLLSEEVKYDENGRNMSTSAFDYMVSGSKDIPADFRINLLNDSSSDKSVFKGTKALGEQPTSMATSVLCALRQAIASAKKDSNEFICLDTPTTVEKTLLHIMQ